MDVYVGGTMFDSLPKDCYVLKKAGRDVDIVSRHAGLVRALPGDALIRQLPSFRAVSWEVHPGAVFILIASYICYAALLMCRYR